MCSTLALTPLKAFSFAKAKEFAQGSEFKTVAVFMPVDTAKSH
jgi:hypothetical protein